MNIEKDVHLSVLVWFFNCYFGKWHSGTNAMQSMPFEPMPRKKFMVFNNLNFVYSYI